MIARPMESRAPAATALLWGLAALLAYGLVLFLRDTPHMMWGDDSMYILNTQALLGHGSYIHNGYVFNPLAPHKGPPFYPPGTALLLLPVYAIFGFNPTALTAALTAYLIVGMLFAYSLFARLDSPRLAALATVLVLANPYVWQSAAIIASEYPFMLWLYATLLLLQLRERATALMTTIAFSVAVGVAIYISYATRDVGGLLLPAMAIHDVVRIKNVAARLIPAVVAFSAAVAVQHGLLPDQVSVFGITMHEIAHVYASGGRAVAWNIQDYLSGFRYFFPAPELVNLIISALTLGAIAIGMWCRVRTGLTSDTAPGQGRSGVVLRWIRALPIDVLYILGTVALLISLPPEAEGGTRYLLPLLPLFMWYAVLPLRRLRIERARLGALICAAAVVALVGYAVASISLRAVRGPADMPDNGPLSPEAQAAFRAIDSVADGKSIVVFAKPRAIALYGRRKAIAWPTDTRERTVEAFLRDRRLTHVLVWKDGGGGQPEDVEPLLTRIGVDKAFSNSRFELYTIVHNPSVPSK